MNRARRRNVAKLVAAELIRAHILHAHDLEGVRHELNEIAIAITNSMGERAYNQAIIDRRPVA